MFSKGSDPNEERLRRLETFASTTLVSYLCNMKLFGVSKDLFHETEDFLCNVYHLNKEEINESVKAVSESEERSSSNNNNVSSVKIGVSDNDVFIEHKNNVKGGVIDKDNEREG